MSSIAPLPSQQSLPHIMLIDDDPIWLMSTGKGLRERGFIVTELPGITLGLPELNDNPPDGAIVGERVAGQSGAEICRKLREHPAGALVPILWLSDQSDDAATRHAGDAGAADYCLRSFSPGTLAHRLQQLLRISQLERSLGQGSSGKPVRAKPAMAGFEWLPRDCRVQGKADLFSLLEWPGQPDSLPHRDLLSLIAKPDRRRLWSVLARLLSGGPTVRQEVGVITGTGNLRRLRIDVREVHADARGPVRVCGVIHDVTPAGGSDPHIYQITHFDSLTGLPNRAWLLNHLRSKPSPSSGLRGFASIEIDRFQLVLEALGPTATDRLFVEVTHRLRRLANEARSLKDDFAVGTCIEAVTYHGVNSLGLLIDRLTDSGAALRFARAVVDSFDEPFLVGGRECFLRASVGVHVSSGQLIDPAPWITHADHARRVAATDGGDTAILFDASMSEGEADRLDMESGLRKALERGEMSMHFQPQFSAWDRQLVGFEALMRWERNGKMQPAGKFIALAEETNLIIPLGEWAVDETCKALAALKRLGRTDCSIAVNLSSKQLHTGTLPAVIDKALTRHAVDANSLDVELTESSMMKDAERAVEALKAIRALGVGLAVDDFGTGHSSLAYLTRLPLTTLKIDRSFVQDVHTSERSRAVASAIVALAANLHLSVVAEGVETEEQRQTLMALGCDLHQGWLYARAVPLDQALHIAAEDSARRSLSELAV
jgi:EAL domain-containing protein (putative c-di-GMP-specific phosphodiesterase class I)/GGDEF domain-containing protein/CheY-like chemotaxis protein